MKWYNVLALLLFLAVLAIGYWAILDWDGFIAFVSYWNTLLFE